ncbi:MAG: hypothetical protein LC657_19025, partial [Desulfobacteraceae bacterium]|nr:hypothetical protein [Desulfobacteraceae bacterium]
IDILDNIKNAADSPVLLHVTTVKGKGYAPAEKNPVYFHGVGSFAVDTGKANGKKGYQISGEFTQYYKTRGFQNPVSCTAA